MQVAPKPAAAAAEPSREQRMTKRDGPKLAGGILTHCSSHELDLRRRRNMHIIDPVPYFQLKQSHLPSCLWMHPSSNLILSFPFFNTYSDSYNDNRIRVLILALRHIPVSSRPEKLRSHMFYTR